MSLHKNNSMMLISSTWGEIPKPTFRLISISTDCPFNEVIFSVDDSTLAIVAKDKKEAFQLVPKLTPTGERETSKKDGRQVLERRTIEAYYEYYITNPAEIEEFINMFAVNTGTFDWKKYLPAPAAQAEAA